MVTHLRSLQISIYCEVLDGIHDGMTGLWGEAGKVSQDTHCFVGP